MGNNAFQIVIGGYGQTVVSSIEQAKHHLAAHVAPEKADLERLGSSEEYPALATQELAGSYFQRVRHAAEGTAESIEIVMHDTNAAPGTTTARTSLDIINDFDPAYELQAFLYKACESDEDLGDLAAELQIEIHDGVQHARRFGETDEDFVDRLRTYGKWMEGNTVIPETGDATRILEDLPMSVRAKFEEFAHKAFPEESPNP